MSYKIFIIHLTPGGTKLGEATSRSVHESFDAGPGNQTERVHVPNFWGLSGSEDRGGSEKITNSLILRGWVTKVLKNSDEKWGGGWKGG